MNDGKRESSRHESSSSIRFPPLFFFSHSLSLSLSLKKKKKKNSTAASSFLRP